MGSFARLEERIGYRFKQEGLLQRALTHASVPMQRDHNETLEFLGDRILGLVIAEHLFVHQVHSEVGKMAQHFSFLVSRHVCAEITSRLSLLEDAHLAKGISTDQQVNKAVHANLCEALIAAIYLDGGIEAARAFIQRFWHEWLSEDFGRNFTKSDKNILQEFAQSVGGGIPRYLVVSHSGPAHAPLFVVEVEVEKLGCACGEGASRRAAEKVAAKNLLAQLLQNRSEAME